MPYSVVVGYIVFEDSEDGDSKVLWITGILSQQYMVSQPRRSWHEQRTSELTVVTDYLASWQYPGV
jgi:hypothetical protein